MNPLVRLLTEAGLTGRGGADFPTAVKVEMAQNHSADVIVNACDGELGARKDSWVIAHHLDEVLSGARLVTRGRITLAAHQRSATLTTLTRYGVDSLEVPNRYVASEESALVSLAHGGPARPLTRRKPVTAGARSHSGRRLPPTLVLNAETVWRIAQIADHGPRWFRSFGTPTEPGPRLLTTITSSSLSRVHPAEAGLTVPEILALADTTLESVSAIWFGGLGGGFLTATDAPTATWSRAGLRHFGIQPGSGTVRVIGAHDSPWSIVTAALTYAAGQSAQQCGPCMFGVPALAADTTRLLTDPDPAILQRLTRRLDELTGRGACSYPDGVAGFLKTALNVFGPPCPAIARHRQTTPPPESIQYNSTPKKEERSA
ncbi:NADH-ubiquinone oxidoreductase-F iron-sulfur binding region domain-containing protein [Gordonia polyisoprenivorans]|nr:NADH-ubiquinone oxidoreductase-F iron-sulfur binding region domain-containing protein [Gordonia polyisoprenivorans]